VERVLIDTNVLVSFLTDRNLEQQHKAAELFESGAGRTVELLLHQAVVFELAYVLLNRYGRPPSEVRRILEGLFCLPGVVHVEELPWPRVLRLWPGTFADLADAALAAVCAALNADAIATFDRKFIRRIEDTGLQSWW
jgi:predicted nucleic acid-binding protein